ncbi:MAG: ribose-phosphate pyrophosphokinase [Candidatus Acetothermia bacterium]|nr:ribose-phosphate pyrophosphokinase [Candidatus Acetothermia bacterium]
MNKLGLLSGRANVTLAQEVARLLGAELCPADSEALTPGRFPDGEVRVEIQQTVRGKEVFVFQPLSPPVNDHLMELLLVVDALRRASAQMICAVIPYFGYARQDRKKKGRVPISARLVANMLEAAGVHRVLTMELHAGQIQGFFNVPVDHLRSDKLFADHVKMRYPKLLTNLMVVSPDLGGVWRARRLGRELGTPIAIVEKHRIGIHDEEVEVQYVIGDVDGHDVLLVDDILATGHTLVTAAERLVEAGATQVFAACTHGLFCGDALSVLERSPLQKVFVTDTICPQHVQGHPKVEVVSVAQLIADAIRRIYNRQSVSDLLVRS